MDRTINALPGHRYAPGADPESQSMAADMTNTIMISLDGVMPLYVTMGLLFVVVSRAARRQYRRERRRARARALAQMRAESAPVETGYMATTSGHWGDASQDPAR